MTDLFATVLQMSLTGSYVIAVVVVVRWFVLRRLPKYYTYALWAVVLFRLLSPVTIQNVASLMPQPADPLSTMTREGAATVLPGLNFAVGGNVPITAMVAATPDAVTALSWVWVCGGVLLLGYSVVSCLLLHRRVAGAALIEGNIYQSSAIVSPFVLGLIKPKIYLPPDISSEERSYILRHEQIHIRRLDYLIKPIAFLTLCLHWFNPLCWLAFVLFGRDMEMSCDERVIREMGDDIRPGYSDSLLAMSAKGGFVGGGPLAFGESGVGQRIKNVLNFRKPAFWLTLLAAFVVALAVGGLATNPVESEVVDPTVISQPGPSPDQAAPEAPPEAPPEQNTTKLLETGLTEEETAELEAQETSYNAMTPQEQALAREGGTVGCLRFTHMWWEESIDLNLIRYVGADVFGDWIKQIPDYRCGSIYDFSRQFGLDYETFAGLVIENGLEEIYPLDRLKPRWIYFGLPMNP